MSYDCNNKGRTNRAESNHISGGDKHLDSPTSIFSLPITLWWSLNSDSSLFWKAIETNIFQYYLFNESDVMDSLSLQFGKERWILPLLASVIVISPGRAPRKQSLQIRASPSLLCGSPGNRAWAGIFVFYQINEMRTRLQMTGSRVDKGFAILPCFDIFSSVCKG